MKWIKYLVFLAPCCYMGCSGATDTKGDQNDPAVSGSDDEQMQDETGDLGE